jgi:tRNA pseudouridine13 synthase
LQPPKLERQVGIEVYASCSKGLGGTIRENVEDFIVEELLVDGSKAQAETSESYTEHQVLGCSMAKNRYLLCTMVKRNWDTFVAIKRIANNLGVGSEQIQIAGIKDAKALTAQHITIEGASLEQAQKIYVKDIKIRPLGYLHNKLSTYYLLGNSFNIRIRALNHSKPVIKKRIAETVEELKTVGGIPNFFGHQRFGTIRPITHLVGKEFIKKDVKAAAMLFLAKPSPYEHASSRRARQELQATHDFEKAAKEFPSQLRYEVSMLKHLVKRPDDFAGSFRTLPFKLQELFIQAYESYLFNKFLSRRIAQGLPLNMAEDGDYVVAIERSGLPSLNIFKTVNMENRSEINNSIRSGKLRLAIPLIGFKQHPSQGVQGEIEKHVLEEEEVSPSEFRISSMPEVNTKGRLRAAVIPINNFSTGDISSDANGTVGQEIGVTFMLYRGSYATILLREIMKPRNPIKEGF